MLEDEKMPNEEVSPRKQKRKNNFMKFWKPETDTNVNSKNRKFNGH